MNKPKSRHNYGLGYGFEVMSEAAKVLEEFGIAHDMTVASAHRSPSMCINH